MKKELKDILICLAAVFFALAAFTPMRVQASEKVDYSAVFDADYYCNTYADLRTAIGNDNEALLQHFITFGMQEGRRGNAEFDVKAYMENYPDLVQAFGREDLKSYYLHYISCGKTEGRTAVTTDNAISNNADESAAAPEQPLISSYTTAFDPTESRAVNIALAASKINGMVLQPGQKFSFSDSVGARTAENGYVLGPSFANGKEVLSIGGGICQVSSTMYAAMLQGGIKATQRYPHSMPVDYIPRGMDAAIAVGQKDLTFTNDFEFPIVITAVVQDGTVTVSFLRNF